MNKVIIPSLISALMLFLAIPEGWPYGYYTILRLVVCASAVFVAYVAVIDFEKTKWAYLFGFVALLFNPLIPIHLTKEIWVVIDIMAALLFIISIFVLRNKRHERKK